MPEPLERLKAALADRYRIERELGAGGMATVYLAEDLKHQRMVAVKVLRPELAAVLGAERFVQEIKTTANLQHPNILPLFDSGEADGFLYYVMPYVDGETLRAKLNRETQLGVEEAVKLATEVADALAYAHQHGVIHRDIKPENILLHAGRPLVADFGIALAVSAAAGGRMTETGLSLGTPHYMSPEQATAEKQITARSDIYSLGAVLYEVLTGEPPHMGTSAQVIILKIVSDKARPVAELRKSVPPNVAAVVAKALEKLPADRFDSATGFATALGNPHFGHVKAQPSPVRWPSSAVNRFLWPAVAGVLAVVLIWSRQERPAPPLTRFAVPVVGGLSMTALFYPNLAVAPDGRVLAYAGRAGLAVHRLESGQSTLIPGTEGACCPFFAPQGEAVGFVQGGRTRRISLDGGPITALADFPIRDGNWSADGDIVFSQLFDGVFRLAPGGKPVPLTTVDRDAEGGHAWPQLIEEHGLLLHTVFGPDLLWQNAAVVVLDLDSGRRDTVVRNATFGRYLSTGHLMYVRADGTLEAVAFSPKTRELRGTPQAVVSGVMTGYWGGGASLALSDAGTAAWVHGSTWDAHQLVWYDRSGRRLGVVGRPRTVEALQLSADGGSILTYVASHSADIYSIDTGTGFERRLTFDEATTEDHPLWVAGGRGVVYRAIHGGRDHRVYQIGAVPTEAPALLYTTGTWLGPTSLSADGKWLVATQGWGRPDSVVVIGLGPDSVGSRTVAVGDVQDGALSPDLRWVAFQSSELGKTEVYITSFPDLRNRQQVSLRGGEIPKWASLTGELFFWEGNTLVVARAPGEVGRPWQLQHLFAVPDSILASGKEFAVSADGQLFLIREWSQRSFVEEIEIALNWYDWIVKTVGK